MMTTLNQEIITLSVLQQLLPRLCRAQPNPQWSRCTHVDGVTSTRTDEFDDFRINIHYSYNRKGYRRRLAGQERTTKVSLILESVRGAFRWQNVEFVGGHLVDGSGATICSDKLEPGDYWFADFEPVPSGVLSDTPDTCIVT
jgi:hypothetical protein